MAKQNTTSGSSSHEQNTEVMTHLTLNLTVVLGIVYRRQDHGKPSF